jgi:hypothetical protein
VSARPTIKLNDEMSWKSLLHGDDDDDDDDSWNDKMASEEDRRIQVGW